MLQGQMSLRGQPNSQSITLVSGSTPTTLAGGDLGVVITVPESPFTGQIATIQFDWQSPAIGGNAADVTDFGIGDLDGSNSGILFNFQQISASSYSVQVRLNPDATEYTITVRSNAAALASDANITGTGRRCKRVFYRRNTRYRQTDRENRSAGCASGYCKTGTFNF